MSSKQVSVSLTAPQREWLRGEAARLGLSVGELVRRIVDRDRLSWAGPEPRKLAAEHRETPFVRGRIPTEAERAALRPPKLRSEEDER